MCCDWLDMIVAIAGGFAFGVMLTGLLAKYLIQELSEERVNIHARTQLKNQHIGEWE